MKNIMKLFKSFTYKFNACVEVTDSLQIPFRKVVTLTGNSSSQETAMIPESKKYCSNPNQKFWLQSHCADFTFGIIEIWDSRDLEGSRGSFP